MSEGKEFPLEFAKYWASRYMVDLLEQCDCTDIIAVGSVRRGKQVVHDIEIMLIPGDGVDMFGQAVIGSLLDERISKLESMWNAKIIQNGPKKKKLILSEGITLELHVSNRASWAVECVIRTGPVEFSHKCVTPRKHGGYLPSDCRIANGWQVWRGEKNIPMIDEGDFLKFLGLGWVDPKERNERLSVSVETGVKA